MYRTLHQPVPGNTALHGSVDGCAGSGIVIWGDQAELPKRSRLKARALRPAAAGSYCPLLKPVFTERCSDRAVKGRL